MSGTMGQTKEDWNVSDTIYWEPWMAIETALKQDGMTQKALAEELGWEPSKLSLVLSGKQRLWANDLYIISKIQRRPIEYYYEPPRSLDLRPHSSTQGVLDQPMVAA